MLIIALVLAVIGLAALVTAVVTSNELIAWVCIGASVIGVLLLIVDALRERSRGAKAGDEESPSDADAGETTESFEAVEESPEAREPIDYPEEELVAEPESDVAVESDAADVDVEPDDSVDKRNN
ncbi:hypothetical protein A5740_25265 [Mycobacterium sp. GA-1841]|uniref:hypothetical protein n=1 Tax=Mycobacterium sp. GA-1841 TaxID=1834154 RepID=UPI00096EC0E3|nr:hypothetical protein [Mycobacterium sp. GA-1841]OMC39761.1 hypothetical protein A5740_25265 [Mycobacterium sp. GA-1841]